MKILLLTQVLPYPLDSGPKVKTYYLLRYLAERNAVTLLSFVRGNPVKAIHHLEQICESVHTVPMNRNITHDLLAFFQSLRTGVPFLMVRDQRKAMVQKLEKVTGEQQFDVVHADQLNMAQYAMKVTATKRVLDAHNSLWLLYQRLWKTSKFSVRRMVLKREWKLLKVYERVTANAFDKTLTVSEQDRQAFIKIGVEPDKIAVIPISIDTKQIQIVERDADASHILHLGTMFWPPNSDGVSWFLREVWPKIHKKHPQVVFDLVGADPPQALRQLAQHSENVSVHGYVPDPTMYLKRAGMLVVPLHAAGGMRVKILNAMAQGIPVVSTTMGCEGIHADDRRHLLIADSPSEFAQAVCHLLENPHDAERLARNGRALVESTYDFRVTFNRLGELYSELCTNGKKSDLKI